MDKLTPWAKTIKYSVRNIAENAGGSGYQAKYYTDSSMSYFFDNGRKNPSVAKIITQDELKNKSIFAKFRFFSKYNSKNFAGERQTFEDTFTKLYPNTGDMRTALIDNNRFSLDKVKPKASKLEKFLLGFKL